MTPAPGLARRSKGGILGLLTGFVLGVVSATLWHRFPSNDPFARLEEFDHDSRDLESSSNLNAVAGLISAATPGEKLRQIDAQLRTDPKNPALISAKVHLGLEYAPAATAAECERILAQSPRNYFALHHASMAFLAMTNLSRAMYYAARALQVRDTVEARFVVAHVFYAKRDFKNALDHYRKIVDRDPKNQAAQAYVKRAEKALAGQ